MLERNAKDCLESVRGGLLTPFKYLKSANEYLSSPIHKSIGREFVIRALNDFEKFEKQSDILRSLVRKAGLYPYLKKYFSFSEMSELDLLVSLHQSEVDPNFVFHSMQSRIYNLLTSGRNVVLSAPTSMGKSAIVDSLIASNKFSTVVIVVPTIALIDETRRRIQNSFGHAFQIIHHGSQEKRKKNAIYVLTQERVNERKDLRNIDLFILDEFYKLAYSKEDRSRVIALNIALSRLLSVSKQFYMIGPYIDGFRGMENLEKEYIFIPSEFNTVALNVHEYNINPNNIEAKNKSLNNIMREHQGQTIIYCKSQKSIDQVVTFLDRLPITSGSPELEAYNVWLNKLYGRDWCYSRALARGIAVHHGTLPRALQQKSVELFNSKKVKYLICTSTLIEGVNTAAENVVIYDNKRSTTSLDDFTRKNISGRAGRMNQYLVGNVYCLEGVPSKSPTANIVDLPLGQQDIDTPLNLIAGMQSEHLTEMSKESLSRYTSSSDVPVELIRNHASYDITTIEDAFKWVCELGIIELKALSTKKNPNSRVLDLLTQFIKMVEYGALQRLSYHYLDNQELRNRLAWYIYAPSHTQYIKERIDYIYQSRDGLDLRSEATDKELKVVRNIFKHSVPRALMLFQDLINYRAENFELELKADFGYLVHIFENSHLPSIFSAMEEMGIAVETLEKLVSERLSECSIEVLSRYLRINYKRFDNLNPIDHMFIRLALS